MKTINNPNPIASIGRTNNPNPIASIGRTNNPNPIASTGRISFKKVISAILLFSLLLFFLLAGANSLQAQERKTGWFVGISPYAMDLNLEKTTRQTTRQTTNFSSTGGDIVYDATVPNFALDATHLSQFYTVTEISLEDRLAVAIAAREDAIHLCREGAFPETTSDYEPMVGTVAPDTISLESYNETTDLTAGLSQLLTNTPETTSGISAADCKAFFASRFACSLYFH